MAGSDPGRRPGAFSPAGWVGLRRLSPAARGRWQIVGLLPQVSLTLTIVALVGALVTAALPLGFTLATGALVGAVPQYVMADLIVVLDDGRIRETGSHDQLMRNNGLYAELYRLQAKAYR